MGETRARRYGASGLEARAPLKGLETRKLSASNTTIRQAVELIEIDSAEPVLDSERAAFARISKSIDASGSQFSALKLGGVHWSGEADPGQQSLLLAAGASIGTLEIVHFLPSMSGAVFDLSGASVAVWRHEDWVSLPMMCATRWRIGIGATQPCSRRVTSCPSRPMCMKNSTRVTRSTRKQALRTPSSSTCRSLNPNWLPGGSTSQTGPSPTPQLRASLSELSTWVSTWNGSAIGLLIGVISNLLAKSLPPRIRVLPLLGAQV